MFRCTPWTRRAVCCLTALLLAAGAAQLGALVVPVSGDGVAQKIFRAPGLDIRPGFREVGQLPAQAAERARQDLEALGVGTDAARIDRRSNRWASLLASRPMIPGRGRGNDLTWGSLGASAPRNRGELEGAAHQAFAAYLRSHARELRIDPGQASLRATAPREDLIQLYAARVVDGVTVRGNSLNAVMSQGNLVLLGTTNWGDVDVSTEPTLSLSGATAVMRGHAAPFTDDGTWGKSELVLVPMSAGGDDVDRIPPGRGLTYRLAWAVKPAFPGEHGRFEALVDAHSAELLSFEDTNHYATPREVKGGVLPVSNDGIPPDGVEQAGWPMPFENVTTTTGPVTTDAGGNLPSPVDGNITSNLSGPFIRMNDNCGAISLTSANDIDFGTSPGTDCTTPGFGGAGNTHASRTGFHELNRIKEMGRGQLPGNTWLQQQLTSNMNINSTCNAFWNGTVNFYRSGGGCANTGELAGVFDHEWGHGMDANDATPGVSNPGEGIADVYTALRLNNSCIGRNFRPGVQCGGYGDPCIDCTGIRDIDFAKRLSGLPHDFTWANATCGGGVHCRGYVYSEAVWDLWKRDLPALFGMDNNTALEVVTRMTYIGAGGVGTWYAGSPPFGGCSSSGGYLQYLAADDDDGDINNGTPHMQAIFDAFNRHEIACNTPAVTDSGCAGTPASAPAVTLTPADKSMGLSWTSVTGATKYQVFRTDGVFACDFGKVKAGETIGTTFNDTGLQNGRTYSYVVVPIGAADACMGPASSCASANPAAGPNLDVDTNSAVLTITSGDGDEFLDNCENATMTFDVFNTGLGTLTNVRITNVTPVSHPATSVTTSFPAAVSPSTLGEGASGTGSFDFIAGGLAFNDTLVFQVDVTADELSPTVKSANLVVESTESDFQVLASKTFTFETDFEDWTVEQGTFNRSSALGGGDGTSWALESSNGIHNNCDRSRSPILRLQSTSTMTLWNNFDIEPFSASTWYDRANVGVVDDGGARTLVTPDGGRLYNADSNGPGNYSGCNDPEEGWADTQATWGTSSWSSTALQSGALAGQPIQLEVIYGTDPALANRGFSFDQVTVTDVEFQVVDGQSNTCAGCTVNADCDDALFCNGAETCVAGSCQPGTPVDCDDGVSCTNDSCNEATDLCDNIASDANCDNGLFCDGAETCDPLLDCQVGTPVDCDDGVGCTNDSCNEGTDSCDNVPDDAACDNGLFCDGAETCDPVLDCQVGPDPCAPTQTCDEVNDVCVGDCGDGICGAGEDCVSCSADCPSLPIPGAVCGNGLCEAGDGETCVSCPADCAGQTGGKPSNRFCCGIGDGLNPDGCGDARCFTGGFACTETPTGSGGGNSCCGDGTCEGAEDIANCAIDCDTCGNGVCDPNEDQCTCAVDCGLPPADEVGLCGDGADNDCDGFPDCADADCSTDPVCICLPKGDACTLDSECCSSDCKNNGTCR